MRKEVIMANEIGVGIPVERKNTGKPKLANVLYMPAAIEGLAAVMEYGARKYSHPRERAWCSYNIDEVFDSLYRHLQAHMEGNFIDPESGLPHMAAVMFNAAAALEIMSASKGLSEVVERSYHDLWNGNN